MHVGRGNEKEKLLSGLTIRSGDRQLIKHLDKVLGVDINPSMQPEEVPDNLYLQVDDLNHRFTFHAHNFDLVHSQMMATGIHANRWSQYLRDVFRVTRGGGWCQLVELYYNVQSDNGSLTDG
jgi:hypothetical protein